MFLMCPICISTLKYFIIDYINSSINNFTEYIDNICCVIKQQIFNDIRRCEVTREKGKGIQKNILLLKFKNSPTAATTI